MPAETIDASAAAAPALEVQRLSVQLAGHTILDDVSFSLQAGQLAGLIGSNGAGKTTLLRTILGLQKASGGRVQAEPIVGYVPQKLQIDAGLPLRGRDLVALGIDGHRLGLPLPSRARRERVQEMIEAVGAQAFADRRVGRLSGGEQQRILLAHALIRRPRLLLLDEPLASLDLRSAREVVGVLAAITSRHKVAVLISAHDLNPLLGAIDRVVYLADGRAVQGTVEEVIRSDVLSRLYRHRVDVLRVHGRVIVLAGEGDPASAGQDRAADHDSLRLA